MSSAEWSYESTMAASTLEDGLGASGAHDGVEGGDGRGGDGMGGDGTGGDGKGGDGKGNVDAGARIGGGGDGSTTVASGGGIGGGGGGEHSGRASLSTRFHASKRALGLSQVVTRNELMVAFP